MRYDERRPTRVDLWVGKRMRKRRLELDLSQQKVAELLGITFQQVQKYEAGSNRISASRLFDIAGVLDTPVEYYFQGLSGPAGRKSSAKAHSGQAAPRSAARAAKRRVRKA